VVGYYVAQRMPNKGITFVAIGDVGDGIPATMRSRYAPATEAPPPETIGDQANTRTPTGLSSILRGSRYGPAGDPAPVHPHLFRHARARQIVRTTKSLPVAQKQAGWSQLQMAYLTVSDDEVRRAMQAVDD
jgi:integrase